MPTAVASSVAAHGPSRSRARISSREGVDSAWNMAATCGAFCGVRRACGAAALLSGAFTPLPMVTMLRR